MRELKQDIDLLLIDCVPLLYEGEVTVLEDVALIPLQALDEQSIKDPYTKRGVFLRQAIVEFDFDGGALIVSSGSEIGRETLPILISRSKHVVKGTR